MPSQALLARKLESLVIHVLEEISRCPGGNPLRIKYESSKGCEFDVHQGLNRPGTAQTVELGDNFYVQHGMLFHTVSLVYANLIHDDFFTKRDLYYSHVQLFKSQQRSDHAIELVSDLFSCSRIQMHVVGSPRGLVEGNVTYVLDNNTVNCSRAQPIPSLADRIHEMSGNFKFVLIVEKETVFHRLREEKFSQTTQSILVTGKGYPCLATRAFLALVKKKFPQVAMFCLVDADVYGADIYCCYRFGSRRLPREASYALVGLHLLGLFLSEVESSNSQPLQPATIDSFRRPLSTSESSKLARILMRPECKACPNLRRHLCNIKDLQFTAELEVLSVSSSHGIAAYVLRKIEASDKTTVVN